MCDLVNINKFGDGVLRGSESSEELPVGMFGTPVSLE